MKRKTITRNFDRHKSKVAGVKSIGEIIREMIERGELRLKEDKA